MKKILLAFFLIFTLFLCSCGANGISEGDMLYDCGAKRIGNVEKFEFLYEEYTEYSGEKLQITDKEDQELFKHYKYLSDFPGNRMHEIYTYPSNTFTFTIDGEAYSFFLHEDGSLTSLLNPNFSKHKTYQADEKYRITPEKLDELIDKYGK